MPKIMVLPAKDAAAIRVIEIPEDLEEHEGLSACRRVNSRDRRE